jgi:hypothetical protein
MSIFQHQTKLFSKCRISLAFSLDFKSNILVKTYFLLNAAFLWKTGI